MGYVSSPAGQIVGVIPDANEDPNLPADLLAIATAIEKRLVGVYATPADRDAKMTTPQEGMFAFTKDTDTFWFRSATAWVSFPPPTPAITHGASVPPNSSGTNGDVFFKV
jgi:hypothetical protein